MLNYDNIVFRVLSKISDCICLSLLFWVSCIPIFTIGTACSALYYTAQKVIKKDEGTLWKSYWKFFRENLKQGFILWLIVLIVYVILLGDIVAMRAFADTSAFAGFGNVFFMIMLFFAVMWSNYIFAYLAKFENKTKDILKNTLLLVFYMLPKTLLLAVFLAVCVLTVCVVPMLIVIIPTVYILIEGIIMEKVFDRLIKAE